MRQIFFEFPVLGFCKVVSEELKPKTYNLQPINISFVGHKANPDSLPYIREAIFVNSGRRLFALNDSSGKGVAVTPRNNSSGKSRANCLGLPRSPKGVFEESEANWAVCPTFATRFSSFQGVTTAT